MFCRRFWQWQMGMYMFIVGNLATFVARGQSKPHFWKTMLNAHIQLLVTHAMFTLCSFCFSVVADWLGLCSIHQQFGLRCGSSEREGAFAMDLGNCPNCCRECRACGLWQQSQPRVFGCTASSFVQARRHGSLHDHGIWWR